MHAHAHVQQTVTILFMYFLWAGCQDKNKGLLKKNTKIKKIHLVIFFSILLFFANLTSTNTVKTGHNNGSEDWHMVLLNLLCFSNFFII